VHSSGEAIDSMEKKMVNFMGGKSTPGPQAPPADPVQWLPAKDERLMEHSLCELCVRLKNLKWGALQVQSLEEDVHKLWETELDRRFGCEDSGSAAAEARHLEENKLGEILVTSQMVCWFAHFALSFILQGVHG